MGLRASAWLAKYRQGSFRGAAFHLRSHQKEGGRRVQEHEFPQLNQSRSEDLGRKIGRFTLDMYVIGEDYFADRDALEFVLNREGSGELIHPYLGRLTVQAGDYVMSETVEEGRVARFTVKFSEAGAPLFPAAFNDAIQNVSATANENIAKAESSFEDIYDIANTPAFVVQAAANSVGKLNDFMDTAAKKVTQPITNLTFAIRNLKAEVEELVQKPQELADRIRGIYETLLAELNDNPETAIEILKKFKTLENEYEEVTGETPSRTKERINQEAIIALGKDMAFSHQALAVAATTFGSTQEAVAERDDLVDSLDLRATQIADAENGDDDLFQANKDLQAALSVAIPQAGISELITFTPQQTLPVLVIAHKLFGNINKEQEIIDQNLIEHPGFAPGGTELEVSNG